MVGDTEVTLSDDWKKVVSGLTTDVDEFIIAIPRLYRFEVFEGSGEKYDPRANRMIPSPHYQRVPA